MQFGAVLASAESKGDAPSRFELRSNPATDEVVFYVSPDPALPQKPRDYSHATRGGNRCATRARPAVDARCPFCPGNEKLCNADLATVTTDGAWTARAFDVETKALANLAQPGADFYGIHASNDGKVMIFAGGVPIKEGETVIGAVRVSGGTGKQVSGVRLTTPASPSIIKK